MRRTCWQKISSIQHWSGGVKRWCVCGVLQLNAQPSTYMPNWKWVICSGKPGVKVIWDRIKRSLSFCGASCHVMSVIKLQLCGFCRWPLAETDSTELSSKMFAVYFVILLVLFQWTVCLRLPKCSKSTIVRINGTCFVFSIKCIKVKWSQSAVSCHCSCLSFKRGKNTALVNIVIMNKIWSCSNTMSFNWCFLKREIRGKFVSKMSLSTKRLKGKTHSGVRSVLCTLSAPSQNEAVRMSQQATL